jgi:hypothetical protein
VEFITEETENALMNGEIELTYESILQFIRKNPSLYGYMQYLYDTNSIITKEPILVTEPTLVKSIFDLVWNNQILFEPDLHNTRSSIELYINEKCCEEEINIEDNKSVPKITTIASKYYNKPIELGVRAFYYDLPRNVGNLINNASPIKIFATIIGYNDKNLTTRNLTGLDIILKRDSDNEIIIKSETELYFYSEPLQMPKKIFNKIFQQQRRTHKKRKII